MVLCRRRAPGSQAGRSSRMSGVEATRLICERHEGLSVIGLSMHDEPDMAAAMLASGARAYLTKDGPPGDLLAAIRACAPNRASRPDRG